MHPSCRWSFTEIKASCWQHSAFAGRSLLTLPGFDRGPQVTDEDLSAFEQRWGLPLPEGYREFLLAQNGGHRVTASEMEQAERVPPDVRKQIPPKHHFLSLGVAATAGYTLDDVRTEIDSGVLPELPELRGDLEVSLMWWRHLEYPSSILPIAKTQYGQNELLLQLDGPRTGEVTFLYDPDGYCEWHCEFVAASFGEMVEAFDSWKHA